jgi:hypothetical protein
MIQLHTSSGKADPGGQANPALHGIGVVALARQTLPPGQTAGIDDNGEQYVPCAHTVGADAFAAHDEPPGHGCGSMLPKGQKYPELHGAGVVAFEEQYVPLGQAVSVELLMIDTWNENGYELDEYFSGTILPRLGAVYTSGMIVISRS